MNRNTKQNRRPNSAISGAAAFGSTSRVTSQYRPSPRRRAASTKSCTTTFIATARDRRNTRVASSSAITSTSEVALVPTTLRISRAKISCGMAIRMSTTRDSPWSIAPPLIAAIRPQVPPNRNASTVVRKAMPKVLRAP
ncbi:hypothetical protein D9M73_260000 [compost metagenome]